MNNSKGKQFIKAYHDVLSIEFLSKSGVKCRFTATMKLIYLYLLGWSENPSVSSIFPSQDTISNIIGCSRTSVKNSINELVLCGLIDKINRRGTTSTYVVNSIDCSHKIAGSMTENNGTRYENKQVEHKRKEIKNTRYYTSQTKENSYYELASVDIDELMECNREIPF